MCSLSTNMWSNDENLTAHDLMIQPAASVELSRIKGRGRDDQLKIRSMPCDVLDQAEENLYGSLLAFEIIEFDIRIFVTLYPFSRLLVE